MMFGCCCGISDLKRVRIYENLIIHSQNLINFENVVKINSMQEGLSGFL